MRKKRIFSKGISFVLAGIMTATGVPVSIHGASGYEELRSSSLAINDQMTLFQGIYFNSANAAKTAENYLVYEPGEDITPFVSYGNDVYGAAGISRIYEIEEEAGRRIVAAANGDYFTMATGVSLGAVIKDGLIRTGEHSSFETIGFREDGTAVIGRMGLSINVLNLNTGGAFNNVGFNKTLTLNNGVVLYSEDFGPTNEAAFPTRNVIIDLESGQASPGEMIQGTVSETFEGTAKTELKEGQFVLSVALDCPYASALTILEDMEVGDSIVFDFITDNQWHDVVQAVGVEKRLITDGQIASFTDTGRAPRTAIGIREDGSVVLYTVDGRQSDHSMGMTFVELAARMKELGCRDAANLDGGDSTMLFATYPGYEREAQVNQSSGTSLRRCGNYLLFENKQTPSASLRHLHLYPYDTHILAGARLPLELRGSDANYYYVEAPVSGVTYQLSSKSLGVISEEGVLTAGTQTLTGSINVRYGTVRGSASVSVIASPDSVSLVAPETGADVPELLSVAAGETVQFSAEATYKMLKLVSDSAAYSWSVEGNIGTIDANGLFTATTTDLGTGIITATAGSRSDSVKVTVVTEGKTLENFEDEDALSLIPGTYGGLRAAVQTDPAYVHNGRKSLELNYEYDLREVAVATEGAVSVPEERMLPLDQTFAGKSPTMISAWVYGNGSGESIQLSVTANRESQTVTLTELNHQGWKLSYVHLPKGITNLDGLSIRAIPGTQGSGTVYVDQLMAGFGYYLDDKPPVIRADVAASVLVGTITDELDSGLSESDITVTYDGTPIAFDYNTSNKSFSALLPDGDGYEHRVLIRATDRSGNIGRLGFAVATDPTEEDFVREPVFADMVETHWATPYAEYLYRQDIITGRLKGEVRIYDPDSTMTRQEFAAVMVRWLDIDPEEYKDTTLTFADTSAIQEWARDSVRAATAQGFMAGKAVSGSSKIYFDPAGPITRQEVMTVIGRVQEKGYADAEMNFSDAHLVASWALPYVRTLVGQGVISGFDGKLDPAGNVTRAQIAKIIAELN
ncbi:MAG TPA: phosphodiester glycosidase family protein [Bacillota bacterium]|nr:phosphodiester glycosidase family protein [Bacillota bacterium]